MGDDCRDERVQPCFSTLFGVVHELKEREVERQFFSSDAVMGSQP
jgi:hypothetical protein